MRHRVKGRKLNRTSSHRKALMGALATSLLKQLQRQRKMTFTQSARL